MEGPAELVLDAAVTGDVERAHELLEVDDAIPVDVVGPEDVLGEEPGITLGEHFLIHDDELVLVDHPVGVVPVKLVVQVLKEVGCGGKH